MDQEHYSQEELIAVVGKNADSYLEAWAPIISGEKSTNGFHVAGFFLAAYWMGYRKMKNVAAAWFVVVFISVLMEDLVFIHILGRPEPPAFAGSVFGVILAIVCGYWSNTWYLSHVKGVVDSVRTLGLTGEAYYGELTKRGGTSWGHIFVVLGVFFVFLILGFVVGTLKS